MESSRLVELRSSMAKEIRELETAGFPVFGTSERRRMCSGDYVFDWPVAAYH